MSILKIAVLGPPEVHHLNRRLAFCERKVLALLAYLAAERGMQKRQKLTRLQLGPLSAQDSLQSVRSLWEADGAHPSLQGEPACVQPSAQLVQIPGSRPGLTIDSFDTRSDTSELEDCFATMPQMPAYQQPNEEELHTFFEAAISNRACLLNRQLSLKSGSLTYTSAQYAQRTTEPLSDSNSFVKSIDIPELPQPQVTFFSSYSGSAWQRTIVFACAALMFMLLGFDMMGLLVLHAH